MNTTKIGKLLIFIAILIVASAGWAGASERKDLCYAGQYYPEEFLLQGHPQFWEKYGLKVEHILFSSGTENNQALIAGKCQINCGSDSKTAELFSVLGDKVIIIGVIQKGDRYATVVRANSPYKTWQDLKGKTVATRFGTGAEQVLRRYFDKEKDLAWEDFKWVNMKIEDMIAALKSGMVEAFTGWEPICAIAEAQGAGRVLRTYGDVSRVPVALHTTVEFASRNRPAVVKFLAAHLDKADMIRTNPKRAAEIAAQAAGAKGYNVSADAFERVFKRIDFSLDMDEKLIAEIQDTARFLYQEKKIDKVPVIRYDASFLREAKALRESQRKKQGK